MAKNGTCFYFFIISCCFLMGCFSRKNNKNKIKSEVAVLRAPFDQQEEEIVKSGMSKQHATSLFLRQNLNPHFIDIPTPLDVYNVVCSPPPGMCDSNVVNNAGKNDSRDASKGISYCAGNVVSKDTSNSDNFLSFKSKNKIFYIVDFYFSQMERFGWKYAGQFSAGGEVLLNFVKPDKRSAISIRPYRSGVLVIIFSSHNHNHNPSF